MKDFFKDLMTRYKTKSLIIFLALMAVLFTTAYSVQEGYLVIAPIFYAIIPFAIFVAIAFAAWHKSKGEYKKSWNEDPTQKTYYVGGPLGKDTNDGLTPKTAFKTVQRAMEVLKAGDDVKVLTASYKEVAKPKK